MKGFRHDIEGLRGVAVLLVVACHLTGWPQGGFLGVDVFFVLSGFLITGLLVSEGERSGRIGLRQFYARRARRLLPAGVLVLVATDLVGGLLLLPARAHSTVTDSLWALASLANVHFAQLGTDYFSQARPASPLQHYWSLSVEEQFYFVWPALTLLGIAVAKRAGWPLRRVLTVVAAFVVAVSLTWSLLATAATPTSAYFSAPARGWELGAGALLALLRPAVRSRPVIAVAGAIALAVSVLVIGPTTPVPGYAAVLPAIGTVALILGAPAWLGVRPLRTVGRVSYSLYLWHWPVMVLAAEVPGGNSITGKVLTALFIWTLSVASYYVVEAPVRASSWLLPRGHRHRRPLRRGTAPAWAAAVAGVLAVSFVLTTPGTDRGAVPAAPADVGPQIRSGLALSVWPPGLDDLANEAAPEWIHDKCLDVDSRNAAKCTYGPVKSKRVAALLGDSVAISWLPALRAAAAREGWRIHVLTHRQCPNPVIPAGQAEAVSKSCEQHHAWVSEQLEELRPELLVMSNRYGGAEDWQWLAGTRALLAQLSSVKARTVVLSPPPDTGNLQKCRRRLSQPSECTKPVSDLWREFASAERIAAKEYRARFVDTRSWFCASDLCPAVIAGEPVHVDGHHLSAPYARFLGPYVEQVLRA